MAQPLAGGAAGQEASFLVESKRVKCLLGAEEAFADLRGYCDFDSMLQYRLDKERALVMISHFSQSSQDATPLLTVDYMQKVSESHLEPMKDSLREEAALLMLQSDDEASKPRSSLSSPADSKRARFLQREQTTPSHR